jgi:hypothetical protein
MEVLNDCVNTKSATIHACNASLRGCLFGLFLAFHRKKLPKRTKQLASASCFDEATELYRQTRESRSEGASRGFVYRDRNVFRIRTYRSELITEECHR